MREFPKVEAEMMFLTEAEDGRPQLPEFADPMAYRPDFVVDDGECLGTKLMICCRERWLAVAGIAALG